MKRFILFFALLCSVSLSFAQHLKFMGFPLDGTINNFESKLKTKGVSVSPINDLAPVGIRIFSGRFVEEDASIAIFYDATTKTVFGANVEIVSDENNYSSLYFRIENMLKKKYGEDNVVPANDDLDEFLAGIIDHHKVILDEGTIDLKLDVSDDEHKVSLIYIDDANLIKTRKGREQRSYDDL